MLSIPAPDSDKFTLDFFKTLAEGMKAIVDKTVKTYPPIDAKIEEEITKNLEIVENLFEMGNMTSFTEFFKGINDTVLYLSSSVFQTYGFEAGGTAGKDLTAENEFRAGIFTMGTLVSSSYSIEISRELTMFSLFTSLSPPDLRSSFWVF